MEAASLANEIEFQKEQRIWHEQELAFREKELLRMEIDDARRAANEKAEQLKAISGLSALIAGFAMVVQTNVQLDPSLNSYVMYSLAVITASVVSLMLYAMIKATLILIAVFRFRYEKIAGWESRKGWKCFEDKWNAEMESDWQLAFSAFCTGVPIFVVLLGVVGWAVFWNHEARNASAGIVMTISGLLLVSWFYIYKRYSVLRFGFL